MIWERRAGPESAAELRREYNARHGAGLLRDRDRFYRMVFRRMAARSGAALLDLGCGGGFLLREAAGLVRVGLEISDVALAAARVNAPGSRLVLGQGERLPFPDGSFDLVLGAGALHARADRDRAAAEIRRVLKPGGALVLHEPLLAEGTPLSEEVDLRPLGADAARRIREAEEEIRREPRDPRMSLSVESLAALLTAAGFVDVAVEKAVETAARKVSPETLSRWFSARREGGLESYEEVLLRRLARDEVAAYRRLLEEKLLDRSLQRPAPAALAFARKP